MTPATLRSWRAALTLSPTAAAALLGISRRQYDRLETGRSRITPAMEKLVRLLGVKNTKQP